MVEITEFEMIKQVANDYSICISKRVEKKFEDYPTYGGIRKIHSHRDAVIVKRDGTEVPYMIDYNNRNNAELRDFDHIYVIRPKSLIEILDEAEIELKAEPCRICEGGGWSSQGVRLYYHKFYCEVNGRLSDYSS